MLNTENTLSSLSANPRATNASPSGDGNVTGDFETFLRLLTTQLRNQDPLKPLDSTEFVAQLASFSAVEQQVRSNEMLEQIFGVMQSGMMTGLAEWVGKQVQSPGPVRFDGQPVEFTVEPDLSADRVEVAVLNEDGSVLTRFPGGPTVRHYMWDGSLAGGGMAEPGNYRFQVIRYQGTKIISEATGLGWAEVTEIRMENGVARLLLETGVSIPVSEAQALRSA